MDRRLAVVGSQLLLLRPVPRGSSKDVSRAGVTIVPFSTDDGRVAVDRHGGTETIARVAVFGSQLLLLCPCPRGASKDVSRAEESSSPTAPMTAVSP